MPKDRPGRRASALALVLLAGGVAAGCRHTRSEVPPERPYLAPGGLPAAAPPGAAPHVGFSTEPPAQGHALGTAAMTSPSVPGTSPGYGPAPATSALPPPDPLQNLPGPGSTVPPGTALPPRGQMGISGAPPSPL